ncbi:MAG: galactokinase [Victivallaceae bacterium]|nr:galactokinase [Victivallaceae bacterium]
MDKLVEKFKAFYHAAPTAGGEAPGRLEILGNHTDYNQGFVLSCAVGNTTAFVLRPVDGQVCRVKDFRDGSEKSFDLDAIDRATPRDWSNYIKGVIVELRKRGIEIPAFEAGMESTVPLSAGMSSSAALETAAGFAFAGGFGVKLDQADWARVGQGVENNYMGLKTGLLDQFSSIFGRRDSMILSDFRTVEVLRTVPLPAGFSIVVVNSMVKHNLVDSEYNVRRLDCESAAAKLAQIFPDVKTLRDVSLEQLAQAEPALERREFRRALHVVGECTRVQEAVRILENGDAAGFGRLWFESHESSRVNFENSTPELDYLVELAKSLPGCLGARLSGGGFGGITIHLVESALAGEYAGRIAAGYKIRTGIEPECIICAIGDGARTFNF